AVEDAARAMNSALASWPGLEAVPPARRGEQIERYLRSYRTLLSGISGLALLAAVFVAGSAVATSVAARRREIASPPAGAACGAPLAGGRPARAAPRAGPRAAGRRGAPPLASRRWPASGSLAAALLITGAGLSSEVWLDSPWSGNLAAVAADFTLVILFMRRADSIAKALLTPLRRWLGFAGRLAVDRLLRIPDQLALAAGVLALGLGL